MLGKQSYDIWGRKNGYNIATEVSGRGWMVQNENINTAYTTTQSNNLNMRANLQPFKDFVIELTLNRNYSTNSSEFYRWNTTSSDFESQSRVETATLTYTSLSIGSAFAMLGSDYQSQTFSTLLSNRENVSSLVGSQNQMQTYCLQLLFWLFF